MHLAILADIHGNLPALESVLKDIQQCGVDGIIVAGDFIGGPQPQDTVDLLRSLSSCMIRGNGENYLVAFDTGKAPKAWRESYQYASMRWSYESLDEETLRYVAALPEQRVIPGDGTSPIRVIHGSLRSPDEGLYPDRDPDALEVFRKAGLLAADAEPDNLEEILFSVQEPVVVCGHTHIPWKQEGDRLLVVNPGSVGAPLNGDNRAQYALLKWNDGKWEVTHRAIEYDLGLVRSAYYESGYLSEGGAFARACLLGVETGQNTVGAFLSHVSKLAAEAGYEDSEVVPDGVWEQAIETFNWSVA